MKKQPKEEEPRIPVTDFVSLRMAIRQSMDSVVLFYLQSGLEDSIGVALWDYVERKGQGGCCLSEAEFRMLKREFGHRIKFVEGTPK